MAKSVTLAGCLLHASFSFIIFGSAGKGFRPLQWWGLANSLLCKDIFCVFVCTSLFVLLFYSPILSLKFMMSSFGFGGEIYPEYLLALINCKVAIFIYIFNNVYLHVKLQVETIDFSNWRPPIKVHHQFQFMVVAENRAFKLDPAAKLNNVPPGIS